MPKIFVMVGLPASGKSTFSKTLVCGDTFIYSTDDFIEEYARKQGKTYNDVFQEAIKLASDHCDKELKRAYQQKMNIIFDQTNMAKKKRIGVLSNVPKGYTKICYCVEPPKTDAERDLLNIRLNSRPGKTIPDFVILNMTLNYEEPSLDEGFDEIYITPLTKKYKWKKK